VLVAEGGADAKMWTRVEGTDGFKWVVAGSLEYQDRGIKQVEVGIKLKVSNTATFLKQNKPKDHLVCIVIVHEGGYISFWSQDSWDFLYAIKLRASGARKIVFENSNRFMAALTDTGGVEVWKVKGKDARHSWDLDFTTVTQIESNQFKEN